MGKVKKPKLTDKQKKFADHYLKYNNGTKAYFKAYPTTKKRVTAETNASKLLRNTKVAEYLRKQREKMQKKTDIDQARLLEEEACISLLDPAELYDLKEGTPKAPHELPEKIRRAISSIEIKKTPIPGSGGKTETTYKYKFWDKGKSLERVEKHLGMFEKDNAQKSDKIIIMADGRVKKNG